jgi:hypothetical protein
MKISNDARRASATRPCDLDVIEDEERCARRLERGVERR